MALLHSSESAPNSLAPSFSLPGVDGRVYSLDSFSDRKGLLVVFMCNHCPYVIAVHERLSALAREFEPLGIAVIGINSNDPAYRESDSFENMKKITAEWGLPFPYVFDESQETAKAYDAVCTPDPYLYYRASDGFRLAYRGRIDDSWKDASQVKSRDLSEAMLAVSEGRPPREEQIPSMGCSIKWKAITEAKARG
jgi:peroxiredoxin